MLHSIVIHPDFFRSIKDNEELQNHFEDFYNKIKPQALDARDILFRVDDKNETLKNEYNEIIKSITPGDKLKQLIEDFFLKQLYVEKININFQTSNLDATINDLNYINFYFSKVTDLQKKLNFKKDYYSLDKLKKSSFEDLIIGLTRFAKKITFADPYIAQRITNLEQKKINKATMTKVSVKADESPEDFKIEIKKTNNEYKVSIKRLLDIIYENNIFREDFDEDGNPILQIEILTSLKREDIKKIKHNWSEHFININDKILFALSDTSRPNCKLELKIVRQWDDKYEGAQFYGKSLIIKGDAKETVVNVGKGLNFYTDYSGYNKINRAYEKKPLKLKKENAYTLELVRSDKRPRFTTPTRFTPIDANSFESKADIDIKKYLST